MHVRHRLTRSCAILHRECESACSDVRLQLGKEKAGKDKVFVHMLNATLCATERTMCCILENNQTPEGVKVPKCLQPFMGGMDFLPYNKKATEQFMEKKAKEEAKVKKK